MHVVRKEIKIRGIILSYYRFNKEKRRYTKFLKIQKLLPFYMAVGTYARSEKRV